MCVGSEAFAVLQTLRGFSFCWSNLLQNVYQHAGYGASRMTANSSSPQCMRCYLSPLGATFRLLDDGEHYVHVHPSSRPKVRQKNRCSSSDDLWREEHCLAAPAQSNIAVALPLRRRIQLGRSPVLRFSLSVR